MTDWPFELIFISMFNITTSFNIQSIQGPTSRNTNAKITFVISKKYYV